LKLNLGCGYNKLEGYVNVDNDPSCNPDKIVDLEKKLPWKDNSVDEIIISHVLEHLGQDTKSYFAIWKEFYRILKDGAEIYITVPHHRHDNFVHDPTHVRAITPVGIDMFNQRKNTETIENHGQETTLGLQLGIDIAVIDIKHDPTPWFEAYAKTLPPEAVNIEFNKYNNTCYQVHIKAKAYKPARSLR